MSVSIGKPRWKLALVSAALTGAILSGPLDTASAATLKHHQRHAAQTYVSGSSGQYLSYSGLDNFPGSGNN